MLVRSAEKFAEPRWAARLDALKGCVLRCERQKRSRASAALQSAIE